MQTQSSVQYNRDEKPTAAHASVSPDHYRLSTVEIKEDRAQANAGPVNGNKRTRPMFEELVLPKQRELSLRMA